MCPPSSGLSAADLASISRQNIDVVPSCVPDNEVSQSDYAYASRHLHPDILAHSIRVYLYCKALAEREQSDYATPEKLPLLFTACIYHDVGTCAAHDGSQRFEVEGADAAAQALRSRGASEVDARDVWVVIALHTSPGIAERISPLARLLRLGVIIDFKRPAGLRMTRDDEIREIEAAFPRGAIEKVLGDAVVEQALKVADQEAKGVKAPAASWPGVLVKSKLEHPEWEGVNKAF
jgi:hypothetical protein